MVLDLHDPPGQGGLRYRKTVRRLAEAFQFGNHQEGPDILKAHIHLFFCINILT